MFDKKGRKGHKGFEGGGDNGYVCRSNQKGRLVPSWRMRGDGG